MARNEAMVLFDLRHVMPRPTGIGSYLRELVRRVVERKDRPRISFLCNHPVQREIVEGRSRVEVIPFHPPTYGFAEQLGFVRVLREQRPSLAHFPHLVVPILPVGSTRLVVTIYDLIPEIFPHHYSAPARLYRALLLRSVRRRVDHVVTLSRYTRQSIVSRLGLPAERVSVIPPGRDVAAAPWRGKARTEGLIYVGNLKPHKGIPVLLDALRRLQERGLRIPLRMTGTEQELRRRNGGTIPLPPGVEFLGEPAAGELRERMAGSRLLVLPSLYEGFGLPLLEAMSAGIPVVSAASPVPLEVGADAAVFFEPGSAEDLAAAIARLYDDHAELERRSSLGRRRALEYDWDDSAGRLIRLYEDMLVHRKRVGP